MVRQVLNWRKEQPEHAKRVMDEIHRHNMEVEQGLAEICELEASLSTPTDWATMAAQSPEQVHRCSLLWYWYVALTPSMCA